MQLTYLGIEMLYDTIKDKERELWKYCQLEYKRDTEYEFNRLLQERIAQGGRMRKILKSIASIF